MTQIKRMTITELLDASPRVKSAQGALAAADIELEEATEELEAANNAVGKAFKRKALAIADVVAAEIAVLQAHKEDHADELDAALAKAREERING